MTTIFITPKGREIEPKDVDALFEACRFSHKVLSDFIKAAPDYNIMVSKDMQTAFLMCDDAMMPISEDPN